MMADTIILARDLGDMGATAGGIAIDIKYAGKALGDAFDGERDKADAQRGALALLYSARARIAELIAEVEAEP